MGVWLEKEEGKKKLVRSRCFLLGPTKYFLPKMGKKLKRKLEHRPPVHNSMTIVFFFLPLNFTFLMSFSYSSICSICLWNQTGGFSFFPSQKKKISNFFVCFCFCFCQRDFFFPNQCWRFFFFFLIERWLSHTHI